MNITWKLTNNINDEILSIRKEVFVLEQGFKESDEIELDENRYLHLSMFQDKTLIGYCRLYINKDNLHIQRVLIKKDFRNKGYGSMLINKALEIGKEKGCIISSLHSQIGAYAFYQKLGYEITGPMFDECGMDHYPMEKRI